MTATTHAIPAEANGSEEKTYVGGGVKQNSEAERVVSKMAVRGVSVVIIGALDRKWRV
jgi:hypothetical protein